MFIWGMFKMVKRKNKSPLLNGLATGMILQLAIGPVFFYIMNLVLQKTLFDGFAGVLAVTIVDYIYITLAIIGIGKLLENKEYNKTFGIISSIVLIIFGILIIMKVTNMNSSITLDSITSLFTSFTSVFILTIFSPMTIILFTSLFTSKAIEYNYTRKDLIFFGLGTGLATFLFMGTSAIFFSLVKGIISLLLIWISNLIVGFLLVGYGLVRLIKVLNKKFFI
jgi:threonine/homoserine/homoserine lactone efflux protein